MLKTDQTAPALTLPLIGGGTFDLAQETPGNFTMVLFYRGYHCPLCRKQIETDIVPNLSALAEHGVSVVAVSMDGKERADKQVADGWGFGDLRVGYDMSEATARAWGLYISKRWRDHEPTVFSEPGMTLVRADGTVFANWVQSVPFARPKMEDLLASLGFVIENGYPARGSIT